jgi:hypothetical protein
MGIFLALCIYLTVHLYLFIKKSNGYSPLFKNNEIKEKLEPIELLCIAIAILSIIIGSGVAICKNLLSKFN